MRALPPTCPSLLWITLSLHLNWYVCMMTGFFGHRGHWIRPLFLHLCVHFHQSNHYTCWLGGLRAYMHGKKAWCKQARGESSFSYPSPSNTKFVLFFPLEWNFFFEWAPLSIWGGRSSVIPPSQPSRGRDSVSRGHPPPVWRYHLQ